MEFVNKNGQLSRNISGWHNEHATFILNSLGLHRFYHIFLNYYKSVVFNEKDQVVSVILEVMFTSK